MPGRLNLFRYVKAAFKNRWNLLLFGGGVLAAFISGHWDVLLPMVAAAEILYLGVLATNPRYQLLVKSEMGGQQTAMSAQKMRERFEQLYRGLSAHDAGRFDGLRMRCLGLANLATRDSDGNKQHGVGELAQAQLASVNKLLWVYIKLLHTKHTLEIFFMQVNEDEIDSIEADARRVMHQLSAGAEGDGPMAARKRKSIEDTLATVAARRENLRKAQENHEYISIEIQRMEAKLSGIAELAVNRQDPGLLTQDIDYVTRSVEATEEAIGELQSLTGLSLSDDEFAPEILMVQQSAGR